MQKDSRRQIFISYAHRDSWDIVRRLAFSLSLYMDVFWDRRLQAGPFPPQLYEEIEKSDYFLFLMTPSSLESEWCARELEHAKLQAQSKIIPLRVFPECIHEGLEQEGYNYADFSENFEQGFRGLSQMMLDQPFSSWEYAGHHADPYVIACVGKGLLPGLISRTVAEWVVVEKAWPIVEAYSATRPTLKLLFGLPKTAAGVYRQCKSLKKQFEDNRDTRGWTLIQKIEGLAGICTKDIASLKDEQHSMIGMKTSQIIEMTKELLDREAVRDRDASRLIRVRSFFDFDVAEKLRELIAVHARRSRYLY